MAAEQGMTGPAPTGPPTPAPRRRWPWVAALGGLAVVGAGVGGAVVLDGGAGDAPYCATLDAQARVDARIIAFLRPTSTEEDIARVERLVSNLDQMSDVDFIDQAESFAEAEELFADDPTVVDLLREEDVPPSFRLTVPDETAAGDAEDDLEDDDAVLQVETPVTMGDSVLEVIDLVAEADVEGGLGRFGVWIDPDVAERLTDAVPDPVEADVEVLVEQLAHEDGSIERRHHQAAEAVLADAETRCEDQRPGG